MSKFLIIIMILSLFIDIAIAMDDLDKDAAGATGKARKFVDPSQIKDFTMFPCPHIREIFWGPKPYPQGLVDALTRCTKSASYIPFNESPWNGPKEGEWGYPSEK
ncbi:MAG: hypothetical protein K2W94_02180 [Alphaproteobacteria bacterium]|nr:hypothetical protein [Alphaproteobacteria bacterium]